MANEIKIPFSPPDVKCNGQNETESFNTGIKKYI